MRRRASPATLVLLALLLGACANAPPRRPGPACVPVGLRDLLAQGDEARRHARVDEALRLYEAALARDRRSVPAHLRYVSLLLQQGRRSEALTTYRRRSAAPGASAADRTMHARLETDGSAAALRGTYQQAARADPAEVWWRLALAEVEIAEAEAGIVRREEAEARSDRRAAQAALGEAQARLRHADSVLVAAVALDPGLAEVALYRGLAAAVRGDLEPKAESRRAAYRDAREAFREAVRKDPELAEAWEALGDAHARLGDHDESLAALLMAAELQPADGHLRTAVGVELQRTDRHADAARQYEQATRLTPRDTEPWLLLGDARAEDERWAAALEAYDEALRLDPAGVEALLRRGAALEHLGRRDEARTSYERYLRHGGKRESTVRRRIERLLRDEVPGARP